MKPCRLSASIVLCILLISIVSNMVPGHHGHHFGSVLDPGGSAVPGAIVTATNEMTTAL